MAVTGGKNPRTTLLSSVLAIIIFMVLITAVIWGLFRIAILLKLPLSSFFSKQSTSTAETISPAQEIERSEKKTSMRSPAVPTTNPARLPDLSVQILSEGVIDRITGDIVPRPVTSANDLVAVSFDITNVGAASSGPWYFSAELPTIPHYAYTSPEQSSLPPGAHIENMLRFTRAVPGGTFSVTVDPSNRIDESSKGNDAASWNL